MERIYDADAYVKEFDAVVTGCKEIERGKEKVYAVTLDRTAFFPEGGGQPADIGILGYTRVMDTQEAEGEVIHTVKRPLQVGSSVHGTIDWARRFRHMQQHTGEHIFSGIVHRMYGYDNIGFHMGKDGVTIDFNGMLDDRQIAEAERMANAAVFADLPVTAFYPSREELATLDYRSKKEIEGAVRIVSIPDVDVCACCGTHVARTGEAGPVKVVASEHYKSGIRLTLELGWRAMEDYQRKHTSVKTISALLSAKPDEVADAVEHMKEQMAQEKAASVAVKQRLFDVLLSTVPEGTATGILFEPGLNAQEVRRLADRLSLRAELALVFSGSDEEGYKYVMCSHTADVAALSRRFNSELGGKGGGRPPMIQGSVQAEEARIRAFFS